jgi:hypothetical protein
MFKKTLSVHRYFYSNYYNVKLTEFDVICHQCHNRKCFNPEHLKKGTQLNNAIERANDWDEFQKENKILVDEYLRIKGKLVETYFNWNKDPIELYDE